MSETKQLNQELEEVIKLFEERTGKTVRNIRLIRHDLPPVYSGSSFDLIDIDVLIKGV